MFSPPRHRRLQIPVDDRTLTVEVDGDEAVLRVSPGSTVRTDLDDGPEPVALRVPARALVAALRVAWADEHDLRCFEPWRDVSRDGRWRGYEPFEDRYGYDSGPGRWWDDLGDGDPEGYRDPTVVPFPYRPAPAPARSGAIWEEHEHDTVREMWLAADPDADKQALVRDIALRLERGTGGITARLRLAGCDPTRPGAPWEGPRSGELDEEDPEGAAVDLEEPLPAHADLRGQRGATAGGGAGRTGEVVGGTTR